MDISRRSFIGSALAASGFRCWHVPGAAAAAASPPGDVVARSPWATGLVRPARATAARSTDGGTGAELVAAAVTGNNVIKGWPDMRRVRRATRPRMPPSPTVQPATLFSSFDQQTVTPLRMDAENAATTAALATFTRQ